jgi:SAM-dependent methyltransferase
MAPNGKVKSNYYNKFKQINRFLEMVDDLYKGIAPGESLHAVDFGCGKSYLTFALYHYFKNIKKIDIEITGIDLKQEVINHCNEIAQKIGFEKLKFAHGFIHDFKTEKKIDFVVTLHACDTATDDAILFSLNNQAEKMMFVPCCQHELNKQLSNHPSQILLKHGIFKDRMTEIVTDTMRSQLLEVCGYKVQSMEFIDLAHTAKNVLLRCTKVPRDEKSKELAYEKYLEFKKQWSISPYLEKQLIELKFISP